MSGSDFACARCDFHGDDDSAETHARATQHLRCIVCQRTFLTVHQRQTCAGCVARVRLDLADLTAAYTVITPETVTAMTLLGDGTMQRHAHRYELDSLTPTPHPLDHDAAAVAKPVRDEWASDPFPVVAALASWEDFWRADYGDPAGGKPTLHGVVGYLTANLDTGHRAAQTHLAFDEFAAEVRRLRAAVQQSANLADVPVEAEAECFDCGGPLLRTYEAPLAPIDGRRRGMEWEGLTDDWTCGWCRRAYDQAGYLLALRAEATDRRDVVPQWQRPSVAAWLVNRPFRTVQAWMREMSVRTVCAVETRRQLVWMPDVHAMSAQTGRVRSRESA